MGLKTKKTRPENSPKKEICKETVDKIVNRRTFEPYDKPVVGCRFIRFNVRGESVVGRLGFPIQNFRQGTSYPFQLDSGEIVEIVGNRLLHKQINEGELCGQRVEIVYEGRDFSSGGPWRFHKVYRVYKISHDFVSKKEFESLIKKSKGTKNVK